MTLMLKDPDAVLDYMIDWGAESLGDDQILESEWSVDPDEADGLSVSGSAFDGTTATVTVGGGLSGKLYRLVNRVVLGSGRIDDRSLTVRVENR
jgi:hypothetical protein